MSWPEDYIPKLRPVEAFPLEAAEGQPMFALCDQTGYSQATLSMSAAALDIVSRMDGASTCDQICESFLKDVGVPLSCDDLGKILDHLDEALLLEGENFEKFYATLVEQYRASPVRPACHAEAMGVEAGTAHVFEEILDGKVAARPDAAVVGLVAPHLDYQRGAPCYAAAYSTLQKRSCPERVVVLGTNHFGRSTGVVTTGKDFRSPLGTTVIDAAFLGELEGITGDLRRFELDHAREHSVELQLMWLQHLFGAKRFKLVPLLCPDPCGPTGTRPADECGVDLREFALALRQLLEADNDDTLLVAGADLSHVGMAFGDEHRLEEAFLQDVRDRDAKVLSAIDANDPEGLRNCVASEGNPTRVCSAGCIYALLTALPGLETNVLEYHQAVNEDLQNCVTCCAAVLTRNSPAVP